MVLARGHPERAMSHLSAQGPGSDDTEWDVEKGDWAAEG